MVHKIFTTILLLLVSSIFANDAVFTGQGDTLFPIESTDIAMQKEVLTIDMPEKFSEYIDITVEFDFFNSKETKDVIVGFVSPPQRFLGEGMSPPDISGFSVRNNWQQLTWDISKLESSSFKSNLSTYDGDDYVYFFDTTFKNGSNKLIHKYGYKGLEDAYGGKTILYRLTTGALWANNVIEDFNAEIKVPDNSYLIMDSNDMDIFNWKIEGRGRVHRGEHRTRIFIQQGSLKSKISNFTPKTDLDIYYPSKRYGLMAYSKISKEKPDLPDYLFLQQKFNRPYLDKGKLTNYFSKFTKEELRICRNYIFARKGYIFKDKELQDLFENYMWYVRNPKQSNSLDNLTENEKLIFHIILELEKEKE